MDLSDVESKRNYTWKTAHSNTVVFNETLVKDAAARFPGINVFGMNPGIIKSDIMTGVLGQSSWKLRVQRTLVGLLFQSAETYAEKVVPLVVHPSLEGRTGALFNRHAQPIQPNPWLLADKNFAGVVAAAEGLSLRVLA